MNCPSCGAPMRLKPDMTSFRCDYCQSVVLPEVNVDDGVRVLGELAGQNCPICATDLVHATLDNIRMCYCTKCHGMLVPMGALSALADEEKGQKRGARIQPPGDAADLKRKIDCPACHRRMDTHFYAGPGYVVIDSCENCSLIWLDKGELACIAAASEGPIARTETTTQTFLSSPIMDSSLGRSIATNLAVDVAEDAVFNIVDSLFRG